MKTLYEYIPERREKLQSEIARLESTLSGLKSELRQISVFQATVEVNDSAANASGSKKISETIKDQILKVLSNSTTGMKATEIQTELHRRFQRTVKRESLSPQLTRLNKDGAIERKDGMLWAIPIRKPALTRHACNLAQGYNVQSAQQYGLADKENPQAGT